MLIALCIIGGLACILMGGLSVLIATTVLKPDNRIHALESKLNTQSVEMENVYDQLLRWNKKQPGKSPQDNLPGAGNISDANTRAALRRQLTRGARV